MAGRKKYKKNKYQYNGYGDIWITIGMVVFLIVTFCYHVLNTSEWGVNSVVSKLWWKIVGRTITCSLLIFLSFFKVGVKRKFEKYLLIPLILIMLLVFVPMKNFNGKITTLLYVIWIIVAIITLGLKYIKQVDKNQWAPTSSATFFVISFLFMSLLTVLSKFSPVDFGGIMLISLVICLTVSAILISIFIRKISGFKKKLIFSLSVVFISFLTLLYLLPILNYSLDFREPEQVEGIIVTKEIKSGSRQLTEFQIEVRMDNVTMTINTNAEKYYLINEGDIVVVSNWRGFFGFTYYVLE